jgi:hypothetical protein
MPYINIGKENSNDIDSTIRTGSGQPVVFSHGWLLSIVATSRSILLNAGSDVKLRVLA